MSDERFSKEQAEIDQAAKSAPPPCRQYIEQPPVSAEEISRFANDFDGEWPLCPRCKSRASMLLEKGRHCPTCVVITGRERP